MLEKSIFITGGAGYCGSLLVPYLLKKGFRVTVYNNIYFGDRFLPFVKVNKLYKNKKINYLKNFK